MKTKKVIIASLALLALPLAACSTPSAYADKPDQDILSLSEAPEVFEEATTDYALPLPAGITWPEALPDEMLAKNVKMEEGVPKTTALFYWLCAWEDNYLTAEKGGDVAQQAQALKMIQQFPTLPDYMTYVEDPEKGWISDVVEPALKGDSSGIVNDAKNCGYFYENQ